MNRDDWLCLLVVIANLIAVNVFNGFRDVMETTVTACVWGISFGLLVGLLWRVKSLPGPSDIILPDLHTMSRSPEFDAICQRVIRDTLGHDLPLPAAPAA